MVLRAPRCAASVQPGQFVHLRVATGADILLRRPFSIHRAEGDRIEILYQILGEGTLRMAEKAVGDASMDLVGPLGRGWSVPETITHALFDAKFEILARRKVHAWEVKEAAVTMEDSIEGLALAINLNVHIAS